MARLIVGVSDLLFQSRIEGAVRTRALDCVIADTGPKLQAALTDSAAFAVFDVHETAYEPLEAIEQARAAGIRVLAFGRHTAPADLRAARDAGAEIVVPRSELAERLPELLERLTGTSELGAP
jgi:hypothetical protein